MRHIDIIKLPIKEYNVGLQCMDVVYIYIIDSRSYLYIQKASGFGVKGYLSVSCESLCNIGSFFDEIASAFVRSGVDVHAAEWYLFIVPRSFACVDNEQVPFCV